jgi:hypothetical protein
MFEGSSTRRLTWVGAMLVASSLPAGCGTDPLSMGSGDSGAGGTAGDASGAGSAGASQDTCPISACGPQLGIANHTCDDGSVAGPTGRCLKGSASTCHWEVLTCPPSAGGAGGGGGTANAGGSGGTDPCAGRALPDCKACSDGGGLQDHCGQACTSEGDSCSNQIGDGRTCVNGLWECSIHAPLGTGCNLVCRDPSTGGAGGPNGGAGGGASGGASGADCGALLNDVNAKLAAAQACNTASAKPAGECQGTLEGRCCSVLVEAASSTSSANQAYLDALHAYKQSCKFACPAIACFTPTPGNCVANQNSTAGVCGGGSGQ